MSNSEYDEKSACDDASVVSSISSSEIGGGNTKTPPKKQVSCKKKWCFTLNNWTIEERSAISSKIESLCDRGGFGLEVGEKGTPHLQGWIEFKTKARPMQVFGIPRIHWEGMKGTVQDSINYCSKDGNYWAHGHKIPKPIRVITELRPWQEEVVKMVSSEADDRTINWYWEKTGGVGKSALCKLLCHKHDAIVCSGKAADMKYMIATMYKEKGYFPEIVIFDVPRSSLNYLSYTGIEEIKNGCFASTKYESGMVVMNSPHVIVFANELPDFSAMSADRWNVIDLNNDDEVEELVVGDSQYN